MANTILLKKSNTPGSIPSTLGLGEVAANIADGKLFVLSGSGVVQVGHDKVSKGGDTMTGNLTAPKFITSGGTAAQFLKGNGTLDSTLYQPLLTNPITGTGIAGTLPVFDSSNSLGISNLTDSGTIVSIGVETHITGDIMASRFITTPARTGFLKANGDIDDFTYQNVTEKGAIDGYAPLDGQRKIPAIHLPDPVVVPVQSVNGLTGDVVLTTAEITVSGDNNYVTGADKVKWNGMQPSSEKGQILGYAPLDENKKVPSIHLPAAIAPPVLSVNGQLGDVFLDTDDIPMTGTNKYVTASQITKWDAMQPLSGYGVANGYATLGPDGKIPAGQLGSAVMEFQGTFDPNDTTLANGVGSAGDVWEAIAVGTHNFGAGPITFAIGDWAIYTASNVWEKSLNSNAVTSVNGKVGSVTLITDEIADTADNRYVSDDDITKWNGFQATLDGKVDIAGDTMLGDLTAPHFIRTGFDPTPGATEILLANGNIMTTIDGGTY